MLSKYDIYIGQAVTHNSFDGVFIVSHIDLMNIIADDINPLYSINKDKLTMMVLLRKVPKSKDDEGLSVVDSTEDGTTFKNLTAYSNNSFLKESIENKLYI